MDQSLLKLQTFGELKRADYRTKPVRIEMRDNLLERLRSKEKVLPGIVGYDDTVLPEIENGILAGHHMILLGERGQAKSRIIRSLTALLDEHVAAIAGCEISDDPYAPICGKCQALMAENGDATPIEWLTRDHRYAEKLAPPDLSVADLPGHIHPITYTERPPPPHTAHLH